MNAHRTAIVLALAAALTWGCGDDDSNGGNDGNGNGNGNGNGAPAASCTGLMDSCLDGAIRDRFAACEAATEIVAEGDPAAIACEGCTVATLLTLVGEGALTLQETEDIGDCFEAAAPG